MRTQKIKLLFLFAFMTITATSQVKAQDRPMANASPEERAEIATQKQVEALGLDSDQEQKMLEINTKYIQEMKEIQTGGRSRSTMMKLKDMSKRRDQEVKEVLSKEQYKEYTKLKGERREKMKEQMRSRRGNS